VKNEDEEASQAEAETEWGEGKNAIPEAKVSEDQQGGDDSYWLSLATADTGDEEGETAAGDQDSETPSALEGVPDDGLDDDAYLEQFNHRWGTPKTDDDGGRGGGREVEEEESGSYSETKAADHDIGFPAEEGEGQEKDFDEESVSSVESLVQEAMSGSGDFKRMSTPPASPSKPSTPSSR
jgi:hypothetical protein